jgi:hypothetical protein
VSSGRYVVYKDGLVYSDSPSVAVNAGFVALDSANMTGGSVPPLVSRGSNFIGMSNRAGTLGDDNFIGTFAYVRMWEVHVWIGNGRWWLGGMDGRWCWLMVVVQVGGNGDVGWVDCLEMLVRRCVEDIRWIVVVYVGGIVNGRWVVRR